MLRMLDCESRRGISEFSLSKSLSEWRLGDQWACLVGCWVRGPAGASGCWWESAFWASTTLSTDNDNCKTTTWNDTHSALEFPFSQPTNPLPSVFVLIAFFSPHQNCIATGNYSCWNKYISVKCMLLFAPAKVTSILFWPQQQCHNGNKWSFSLIYCQRIRTDASQDCFPYSNPSKSHAVSKSSRERPSG